MRRTLDERGIGAKIVVMRSNGGEMTLDKAVEAPIQIAVSGPTGGVTGRTDGGTSSPVPRGQWGRGRSVARSHPSCSPTAT